MNTVNLIVRLTRDPELKFTPTGKAICSFSIAFDKGYGDHKHAVFVDCKLWDKKAEAFAQYVKKGQQVGITAELDMESWEDRATGQKRTKLCLDVRDFDLLGNKRDGEQAESRPAQRQETQRVQQQQPARRPPARQEDDFGEGPISDGMEDDDIPF